jgi:hypothetical protein
VKTTFSTRGVNSLRHEGEDREASSGIISACHSLARCHVILGIVLLTLAGVVPWWLYEISSQLRIRDEIRLLFTNPGGPSSPNPDWVAKFGVACGVIAAINTAFLFRCALGLRYFSQSRRVVDLHPAVRRLRTTWFVFSLSMLLVIGTLIYMSYGNMFIPAR